MRLLQTTTNTCFPLASLLAILSLLPSASAAGPQLGSSYCSSSSNSSGNSAVINAAGSTNLSANMVQLTVTGAAQNKVGLFYFGDNEVQLPFGNGLRCVDGNIRRLNPPLVTDSQGSATRVVDMTAFPASQIQPGEARSFQFWFRDGAGFDLSDGVTVQFDGPADRVLMNGYVYTVDPAHSIASAVAISGGRIVYVGSDAGAANYVGPQTDVVDLGGEMLMPGIHDSHVHILEAFHPAVGTCYLPPVNSIQNYIPIIQACAGGQTGTNWVLGYGHSILQLHQFIESGGRPKDVLDQALPNTPAIFMEETSHSYWVNSAGLAAAGITAATPDPPGGVILRDPATGQPNGVLLDAAGEMVMDMVMASPNQVFEQMNYTALLEGLAAANENGITSLCDARGYWKRGHVQAWQKALNMNTLNVRAIVGLWAYPYELNDAQQIADLIALYSNDPTSRLRMSQVKIYADGEISHTTASMLQPYQLDPNFFSNTLAGPQGIKIFDQTRLTNYLTQLEAVGFDAHIHAIGDSGVRDALDAIEAAGIANGGAYAPRHRLTHVHMVHPSDVPRFSSLNVIADFQPIGGTLFNFYYSIYVALGLLNQEGEKIRALYNSGAHVVLSSDYDVGDLSPFVGMHTALTMGGDSLPSIDAAIRAYTVEPSYLMRQEERVGTIELGKRADLIVLDRRIDSIPLNQLAATQVLWTLLDGEEVWRAPGF